MSSCLRVKCLGLEEVVPTLWTEGATGLEVDAVAIGAGVATCAGGRPDTTVTTGVALPLGPTVVQTLLLLDVVEDEVRAL